MSHLVYERLTTALKNGHSVELGRTNGGMI